MEAKFTISGSKTLGYKLTTLLPIEWLKEFSPESRCLVENLYLSENWGYPLDHKYRRVSSTFSLSLEEIQDYVKKVMHEVMEYNELRKTTIKYEYTIDL